jgi:electron transport complex protein RnfG
MVWQNMLIGALILGLFAVTGTGLVALTYEGTAERIIENERQALLRSLHQIIPPDAHDNDIYTDLTTVTDARLGTNDPVTVYRARRGGQPVATVIASTAPDGYNGNIKLLVGIHYDGSLAGVRVISHRETPGLGDAIEADRSDWILGFTDRSLGDPVERQWKVKKDGGAFDQFSGATITPRAIVKAVYNTLRYYREHREALYAKAESGEEK